MKILAHFLILISILATLGCGYKADPFWEHQKQDPNAPIF